MPKRTLLPKIIFGDLHHDPITANILTRLLPRLKEWGYSAYYSETCVDIQEELRQLTAKTSEFKRFRSLFIQRGLDIDNADDYYRYTDSEETRDCISELGFFYPGLMAKSLFLEELLENNISYQPIDLKLPLNEYQIRIPERDEAMTKAFLDTSRLIFSNVGVAHLAGIQKNLIEKLGSASSDEFLFFHIYTDKEAHTQEELLELETLPLGLIKLDASDMNEGDAFDHVIKAIDAFVAAKQLKEKDKAVLAETKEEPVHSKSQTEEDFCKEFFENYQPGCLGGHWTHFKRRNMTKQKIIDYAASHQTSATANALRLMHIPI